MSPAAQAPPDAVLEVRGLAVRAGGTPLVQDVDLVVRRGERVGLIGESGSGKTITALAVMGLLADGLVADGSVRLTAGGRTYELDRLDERARSRVRGRDVAMVFQEPMTALNPAMRVGAQVAEAMTIHGASDRIARARALELLDQVGLPDVPAIAPAYPHQLSGGQRQRVVIAIALANDPALLICDEPSTALDVTVQAQVLDLVVRGVEARDAAMLFITHDLAVVASVCERVLVMYGGRVVEAGTVAEVLTRPRHPYTRGLLAASDLDQVDAHGRLRTIPGTVPTAGRFPSGCVFRTRCERATAECEALPPWTAVAEGTGFACFHPVDGPVTPERPSSTPVELPAPTPVAGTEPPDPAVRVSELSRSYRRPRTSLRRPPAVVEAVRQVSLEVAPGERFGIVGESGSGKTTLLKIIAAVEQPTSGSVEVLGERVTGRPERELGSLRSNLQLVFQDPMGSLDPRMRVRDVVAEPLVAQGHGTPLDRVHEVLVQVGLDPSVADRYPHQFSGGQRQRISIARALAPDPRVLVADEPVSALDVSLRAQVLNVINDLVDRLDLTLVLVSHDLAVVRHLCDRVAVMHRGEVVETGPTAEVYANPQHPYTQRLVAAVPSLQRALAAATSGSS